MTVNSSGHAIAYLNGGGKVEDSTNTITAPTFDTCYLGARADKTLIFDGEIAEVGVWKAQLDDAEVAALAAGVSPLLIRPESLWLYYPCNETVATDGIFERMEGSSLTANDADAAIGERPPIYYPQSPIIGLAAAGAAPAGTRPQNPLGHPFAGPFAGPIG